MIKNIIERFTKLTGDLRYPKLVHKYDPYQIDKQIKNVLIGDIVLVRTKGYFSNILQSLIGSFWTHSAIVVNNQKQIVEAVGSGVRLCSIQSLIYQSDYLAILRLKDISNSERAKITGIALHMIGKPYDYKFNVYNSESVYCSEIIYPIIKG